MIFNLKENNGKLTGVLVADGETNPCNFGQNRNFNRRSPHGLKTQKTFPEA
jgi:hypothetical protein